MIDDDVMYKLRHAVNDRNSSISDVIHVSFAFMELAMLKAEFAGTYEDRLEQCIRNWNTICRRFNDANEE